MEPLLPTLPESYSSYSVVLGDLNGDGVLDLRNLSGQATLQTTVMQQCFLEWEMALLGQLLLMPRYHTHQVQLLLEI